MTTSRPTYSGPRWNPRPLFARPDRAALDSSLFAYGADSASGYSSQGDVLVSETADGVDLNKIWDEAARVMAEWNKRRSALSSLISYSTVNVGDAISQAPGGDNFEEASEFGEPHGLRAAPDALILGYSLRDWDLASRFTWKFLRSATAEQVRSVINRAFEADNRLTTGTLLRRLFDPTEGLNEFAHKVYGLYTGADGITPPPYAGQTFPSTTSHYLVSGAAAIDPGDLLDGVTAVRSKGFGLDATSRLLVLCHPAESEEIATWRRGEESNGVTSKFDFIPSQSAPAYLTTENVVGKVAPGEFAGLEVLGSWGPAWVVPSYDLPQGYIAVVATGGPNSPKNPVAFRQHSNPAYTGLRIIPGRDQRYPLQDSFFQRSFGVGVRYRGAACVVKIAAAGGYTAPTWTWS
ncbi:hypothetical protein [Aldersonia kunmingensis]|uniref:hypothetical protein n=1 Tax=Aldersonia kunmingensis TaxID=408066 RepID=UPI000ACFFA54|nr:hypothetical protein [Aldersonia kunmingensis]